MQRPIEPEIIDVTPRREVRPPAVRRWPLVWSLLKGVVFTASPALLLLWSCAGLVDLASAGHLLAWVPLLILAPLTLGVTLLTVPVVLFLFLSLIAALTGRASVAVRFSSRAQGFKLPPSD